MESHLDYILQLAIVLVWYFSLVRADQKYSISCNKDPFIDKKSYASFLRKSNIFLNGVCEEEHENFPRRMCMVDRESETSMTSETLVASTHPVPVNKGDHNKSKIKMAQRTKSEAKKQGPNKKLKGSKSQRKKNKKKKLSKKKKKS